MKTFAFIDEVIEKYHRHPLARKARQNPNTYTENPDYYKYIKTPVHQLIQLTDYIKKNHPDLATKRFMDVGCGVPVIPTIMQELGCKHVFGLDYDASFAKAFPNIVLQGDLLTYDFSSFDILYSYNPIRNPDLMIQGIKHMTASMKKGAILYFNEACFKLDPVLRGKRFKTMPYACSIRIFVKQ